MKKITGYLIALLIVFSTAGSMLPDSGQADVYPEEPKLFEGSPASDYTSEESKEDGVQSSLSVSPETSAQEVDTAAAFGEHEVSDASHFLMEEEMSEEDSFSETTLHTEVLTKEASSSLRKLTYVSSRNELLRAIYDPEATHIILDKDITLDRTAPTNWQNWQWQWLPPWQLPWQILDPIAVITGYLSGKRTMTIDGQGKYVLTIHEPVNNSVYTAQSGTIYTFKDITIVNNSDSGVVVYNSTNPLTVVFENVRFSGSKMLYVPKGTMSFKGDNTIMISKGPLAEVSAVTVSDSLEVSTTAQGSPIFKMHAQGTVRPSFTIEESAQARFTANQDLGNGYGFFSVSTNYGIDLTVNKAAALRIDISGNNTFCSTSALSNTHINTMIIKEHATVEMNCAGGIILNDVLTVAEGAILRMTYLNKPANDSPKTNLPLIMFEKVGSSKEVMVLNKPELAVFSVSSAERQMFSMKQTNSFRMETTDINCWRSYSEAEALGLPDYMWSSETRNALTATLTQKPGSGIEYIKGGTHGGFNSSFNPLETKVLQLGTSPMPLIPDELSSTADTTTGTTLPGSKVYIEYKEGYDKVGQSVCVADVEGSYTGSLTSDLLTEKTKLNLVAVNNFVAVHSLIEFSDYSKWINVRIPMKMLFGTLEGHNGGTIISPVYEMENLSAFPVGVELSVFQVVYDDGINLLENEDATSEDQALKLDLLFGKDNRIEYLTPQFSPDTSGTSIQVLEKQESISLRLGGQYYGSFISNKPYKPVYSLTWKITKQ